MRYSKFFFLFLAFALLGAISATAGNNDHSNFKTQGYIQSIGSDSLVVNDFVFNVDSTTIVTAVQDSVFSYADLQVNDFVKVKGYAQSDSSNRYFATKIEFKQQQQDSVKIKTRGTITAVTDFTFDVSGYTFQVDSNTVFKAQNDSLLNFSDFVVNMNVKVEAYQDNSGDYIAVQVQAKDMTKSDSKEFDFNGVIDSLASDGFAMNQRFFSVDSLTKYKKSHDQSASFSDLVVGSEIELEALQFSDGSFYAKEVDLRDQSKSYLEFTGTIDSIGANFIQVMDYTVQADSTTRITGSGNQALLFSDLQRGQKVKVHGVESSPNTISANKIKVYEFHSDKEHFKGLVAAIGFDFLKVDQRIYYVDSLTRFKDSLEQSASLTNFSVGDYVRIDAMLRTDSTWYAIKIKQKERRLPELEFTGALDSLFSGGLRVAGNLFWLDSLTQVYDLQDYPMSADSLGLGDLLEVTAAIQADGSFKALQIKQDSRPDLITVDGTVDAVSNNSVWISGPEFQLSQRSVVLDKNYAPIGNNALSPGDQVTLWAVPGTSTAPTVLQIKVNTSVVTGLVKGDLVSGIVRDFVLKQNYPNPFNPTTTIAFKINLSGFHKVRLDIFDATGRLVGTLYNGLLERGSYKFKWNARNNMGRDVASGLYFYRLNLGSQAKTARMLLLR